MSDLNFKNKIVIDVTSEMIGIFQGHIRSHLENDEFKDYYSDVIGSILASITATIIHGWADSVLSPNPNETEYVEAINHMIDSMLVKVSQTVAIKLKHINKEVH